MSDPNTFTLACIIFGTLLIAKTLMGSVISRLPLSAAMVYLGVGVAIGPLGFGLIRLDAFKHVLLLERLTEIAVLISLFTSGLKLELPLRDKRWRIPLLFLVIRPAAVAIGLVGTQVRGSQRRLMAWFGIRGIGSLYYLFYAISHEIEPALAQRLLSITVAVVMASVIAHGVSVTPLMRRYEDKKAAGQNAS